MTFCGSVRYSPIFAKNQPNASGFSLYFLISFFSTIHYVLYDKFLICWFLLGSKITSLNAGKYHIRFEKPLVNVVTILNFTIAFSLF